MLRRTAFLFLFYLSMAGFGFFALLFNAVCWPLTFFPRHRSMETFARVSIHYLMRFWMNYLNAVGVVRTNWPEIGQVRRMRGVVLVANHPNLLDICWILAASRHVTCLMKSDIRGNGFFSASAKLAGYISNDSGMDGLHEAVDRLRGGDILSVFPEGTRTQTFPLGPIRPGFALVAREARAPIRLLFIQSNTRCFTKGVFFRPGPLPIRYGLALGPELAAPPGSSSREIARVVEQSLRAGLESRASGR